MKNLNNTLSRRQFLSLTGKSMAAASLYTTLGQMQMARAATETNEDYKAIVCLFLLGGNDSYNMLVPTDNARYDLYATARQNLAVAQGDLLNISDPTLGNFGFHPACNEMQSLYQSGNLAVLSNTGIIKQPTNRASFLSGTNLPKHLFSHNSQQAAWMSANPDLVSRTGWAGRVADLLTTTNNSDALLAMNISLGGTNLLQTGDATVQYNLSSAGVSRMPVCRQGNSCYNVMQELMNQGLASEHLMHQGHARIRNRAASISEFLDSQLPNAFVPNSADFPTANYAYPGNGNVPQQLQMVSRMISLQQSLQQNRQIFFVTLTGWDTHDNQLQNHPLLLEHLSQNLNAFYLQLQAMDVEDKVLTLTMSDFGRTLTSNGDGSDHGWGGHYLVMGGQNLINGGQIYGSYPDLSLNGADDADNGRMIPSTSIDEYLATVARWYGVTDDEMGDIFPNLVNFGGNSSDLGFINA